MDERQSIDDFLGMKVDGDHQWVKIDEVEFYKRLRTVEEKYLTEWTMGDRNEGEQQLHRILKLKLQLSDYKTENPEYDVLYYRDANSDKISYIGQER